MEAITPKTDFHNTVQQYITAERYQHIKRVEALEKLRQLYEAGEFPTVNDWTNDWNADSVRTALKALNIAVPAYRLKYPHKIK